MRVTVILSDEEHAEVKRRAGMVPLSRYFKAAALGLAAGVRDVDSPNPVGPIEAGLRAGVASVEREAHHPRCQCASCVKPTPAKSTKPGRKS